MPPAVDEANRLITATSSRFPVKCDQRHNWQSRPFSIVCVGADWLALFDAGSVRRLHAWLNVEPGVEQR